MFIQNIFIGDEFSTDFIIFSFYKTIIIYRVVRRLAAIVIMALHS